MRAGPTAGRGDRMDDPGRPTPPSHPGAERARETLRRLRDALREAHDRFGDPAAAAAARVADEMVGRLGDAGPDPPAGPAGSATARAGTPAGETAGTDAPDPSAETSAPNPPETDHVLAALAGGPGLALAFILGPAEHLGPFLEAAGRQVSRPGRQGSPAAASSFSCFARGRNRAK